MEDLNDRELEAILKLIKLTQEGVLKWSVAQPNGDLIANETTRYSNVMTCYYNEKLLRIYFESKQKDAPSPLEKMISSGILGKVDTFPQWVKSPVLEISNEQGQSLWRFPYKSATQDLINSAKYQVAGVKDLLDNILSDSAN
jgi:hypothetical protein